MTARELCLLLNGKIEGDAEIKISKPSKIEEGGEGTVSFIANPKYASFAYSTTASVLIVNDDFVLEKNIKPTLIRVKDAYSSFTKILEKFYHLNTGKQGIEQPSYISKTAVLGKDIYVAAFAYIGENVKIGNGVKIFANAIIGDNVEIGDNTIIYSGAKIYFDCKIGKNGVIHSGAVIGSDGFGFAPQSDGTYQKIPQIGNVLVDDDVEIGANTTIDRATVGSTIIRKGVKLDNLIQVAHNVEIGEYTVIAAQTGISGSTKIGKNCVIGGQVGIVGHLKIADGTKIQAQSGVAKSITEPNQAWSGSPAFEYNASLKSQVFYRNLPQLEKRLKYLENLIEKLQVDEEMLKKK